MNLYGSFKPLNLNPGLVHGLAEGLHLHCVKHMSVKHVISNLLSVIILQIISLKKKKRLDWQPCRRYDSEAQGVTYF